jgi:hypothetical protein
MAEGTRRSVAVGAGLALATGLSAWAAITAPFTESADAVTALALALVAIGVAARWRHRTVLASPSSVPNVGEHGPRWWPWLVLGVALLAWELVCLFLGPRVDHPTVSSLYDSATRWRAVKGVCFFAWLCLGAGLVRLAMVDQ